MVKSADSDLIPVLNIIAHIWNTNNIVFIERETAEKAQEEVRGDLI